ncbi:hypothetical protein [Streptomyces sp. NPDC001880]
MVNSAAFMSAGSGSRRVGRRVAGTVAGSITPVVARKTVCGEATKTSRACWWAWPAGHGKPVGERTGGGHSDRHRDQAEPGRRGGDPAHDPETDHHVGHRAHHGRVGQALDGEAVPALADPQQAERQHRFGRGGLAAYDEDERGEALTVGHDCGRDSGHAGVPFPGGVVPWRPGTILAKKMHWVNN